MSSNGIHISYSLEPHSGREKRSHQRQKKQKDSIHYKINIDKSDVILKIEPNHKFISPSLLIERRTNSYKNVTDSVFRRYGDRSLCHFTGQIVGDSSSKVALETCNGLVSIYSYLF